MKRRIRYHGVLIFLAIITVIVGEKIFLVSYAADFTDYFTDILGVILVTIGFLVRISARGYKAEMSHQGRLLVKDGLYALTRNPMYLGVLLIGLGVVLVIFKLWVFGVFLICFLLFYSPQMRREERVLKEKFGDEFEQYCKEIPLLFPRFRQLTKMRLREAFPLKRPWVRKELVSFVCVFTAIFVFEIVEEKLIKGAPFVKEIIVIGSVVCIILIAIGVGYKDKGG